MFTQRIPGKTPVTRTTGQSAFLAGAWGARAAAQPAPRLPPLRRACRLAVGRGLRRSAVRLHAVGARS